MRVSSIRERSSEQYIIYIYIIAVYCIIYIIYIQIDQEKK